MNNDPQPPVMNPLLTPFASWISLVVTISAVLGASAAGLHTVFDPTATLDQRLVAGALIVVAIGGALHLSAARSIISNVDNPPKVPAALEPHV